MFRKGSHRLKRQRLTKADIVLLTGILFAGILLLALPALSGGEGGYLEIRRGGAVYAVYPLTEDRTIDIGGTNICVIEGGTVHMTGADCPDHSCLDMPSIRHAGETIVCLPNQVVLKITGAREGEYDAVSE